MYASVFSAEFEVSHNTNLTRKRSFYYFEFKPMSGVLSSVLSRSDGHWTSTIQGFYQERKRNTVL